MLNIDLNLIYNKSNLKWLQNRVIFATIYGSRAYGTHKLDSDIDIRGIALPPKEVLLGCIDNFEQAIFNEPYDCTIFSLVKFVKLASQGNPNCLEIIFTDDLDHLFKNNIGESLLLIRDLFISKKCRHSFAGYAYSQLRRLKVHRDWINRGEIARPDRKNFGLNENKIIPEGQLLEIEAAVRKKIDEWNFDTTGMEPDIAIKFKNDIQEKLIDLKLNTEEFENYALNSLNLNDNLTEIFQKERAYKAVLRDYKNWIDWKQNRNKNRFELEEKYGFDLKHALHLVRLYLMCKEILQDHKLIVKRLDAEFLLSIRNGAWAYEQLIEWAHEQDKLLDEIYKTSILRDQPEIKKINFWLINTLEKSF